MIGTLLPETNSLPVDDCDTTLPISCLGSTTLLDEEEGLAAGVAERMSCNAGDVTLLTLADDETIWLGRAAEEGADLLIEIVAETALMFRLGRGLAPGVVIILGARGLVVDWVGD